MVKFVQIVQFYKTLQQLLTVLLFHVFIYQFVPPLFIDLKESKTKQYTR